MSFVASGGTLHWIWNNPAAFGRSSKLLTALDFYHDDALRGHRSEGAAR